MAAGDTLRRITAQDQLILSAAGTLVGIKNPNASGADLRYDASQVTDTIGNKLRRLAVAAAVSNPLTNLPLTPPAAWVASTAYTAGTVVTNGGSQYICYTSGTSAGSGGPSGTGTAPITDNTAAWHYAGVARVSTASPFAPALTYSGSTPAGLTTLYTGVSNPGNFLFAGGTVTASPTVPATQVAFPAVKTGTSGGNCGYSDGTSCFYWSVTFETDAPKVALGANNNNSTPNRIIIDGQYYSDGGDAQSSGNPTWRVLDFSATGGRKTRRITFEGYGNSYFAGVRVDPQSTVWAPQINDLVKVAVLGSSIEGGAGNYPILGSQSWCVQVGRLLGWHDVRNVGIGGTGYLVPGSGFTYAGHINDAISFSPDIVIVGGPINDVNSGGFSASQVQAAAVSLFAQLRAALPNALIIAMGCYPSSTGPNAAALTGDAGVSAAVTQFADGRTFFIPVSADTQGSWISGTGRVGTTTGVGNADFYISNDGTHPNQAGIDYFALRTAASVRANVISVVK